MIDNPLFIIVMLFFRTICVARLVYNNRISLFYMIPDGLSHGEGEVHAAVGPVGFVYAAAEGISPGGIMKSLVPVEGHPVGYIG